MDPWLRLALASLAAWRLTHLLAREDGPGAVLARLRGRLGGWAGEAVGCVYCLSLVVAAPLAAFVTLDPVEWAVSWLAISGAVALVERFAPEPLVIERLAAGQEEPQREREHASDGMLRSGSLRSMGPAGDGDAGVADIGASRDQPRRAGGA